MDIIKNGEYINSEMTIYYVNGKIHRDDGPAIINKDGDKFWYVNDKLHRENGPAIEFSSGKKMWYVNNELHRENGPAIEYSNTQGKGEWFLYGQRHRIDGPAIDSDVKYNNGEYIRGWFILGESMTEEKFNAYIQKQHVIKNINSVNNSLIPSSNKITSSVKI